MERTISMVTPTVPKLPTKLRVAAYARVSSGKDAMLQSLSAQVSYYSDLIQRHTDWEYAGVFADEAMTGTKDTRAEFQRLLTECKAGRIDMILTKSISRFARNTVTLLESVRELKKHNVDVFFERENIHSMSGDGELMLTILASFAQEESLSVSENCKWRIRNKFKDGIPNTFSILGYNFKKGNLTINKEEAKIVKMIFTDYLSGMGRLAIVKRLNEMGIKPKSGGSWGSTKIKEILKNEKYCGDLLLQKVFVADHLTKINKTNNGELPQYFVKDNHEPIIDRDIFDKVQIETGIRAGKYKSQQTTVATYPFTGKIVCSICGKNYRRKLNNAGTKYQKAVWICSTFNTLGKRYCDSKQIPEDILISVTTEVLGLAEFDESTFSQEIKDIQVQRTNLLAFVFNNGDTVKKHWKYKSRSESWSNKSKELARQKSIEWRDKQCQQQKQ